MTSQIDAVLLRAYGWITAVYPPAFRFSFCDSMAADFADALADARTSGRSREVLALLLRVTLDLGWTISGQWLRTSVPWLTAAYATALLVVVEWLSSTMLGARFSPGLLTAGVPLVSVLTFTLWFLVPHVRMRRSRRA